VLLGRKAPFTHLNPGHIVTVHRIFRNITTQEKGDGSLNLSFNSSKASVLIYQKIDW